MPRRWAPCWALALSLLLLAAPSRGSTGSNTPASTGGAAPVPASTAISPAPSAEWDTVALADPLAGRLPSTAYVTVAAVGGSVMLALLGAALYQWRRRVLLTRQLEALRQRQAEEAAALEKAQNVLHPVFIPPVIQNPDSSFHLGSVAVIIEAAHTPGCQPSPCCACSCGAGGKATEPSSPCPECSAAGGSRHGHMLFVRGGESAFARVSLCRTSLAASTVAEEGGEEEAAGSDAAERGEAARYVAGGDAPGGGEGGQQPQRQQEQQQALQREPLAEEEAAAEAAAAAEAGAARQH